MRVILDYNKNMGAVDVTDQMLTAKLVEGKRKKVFHKNLCSVLLWCKQLIKRSYITEQVRNVLRMWKMQLVVHHDVMEEDDMDVKAEGADDEGGVRDRRGQRRSLWRWARASKLSPRAAEKTAAKTPGQLQPRNRLCLSGQGKQDEPT